MLLLSLALLVADPAVAADTATPAAAPAKPKLICKSLMVTGSRLGAGKRECRTKAVWDLLQRNTEDDVRQMQGTTDTRPSNPGG